jgi:methylthioribose-1-phosphate isomerase
MHDSAIWVSENEPVEIGVIDQRYLPFESRVFRIESLYDACYAISEMVVRGAPLIGVTAAYGMYLACLHKEGNNPDEFMMLAKKHLDATRPTAVNLFTMTQRMADVYQMEKHSVNIVRRMLAEANMIREQEIESCRRIGVHGLPLIREMSKIKSGSPVNILTHCNAGWLACVRWGTATAPIYMAHQAGIPVHVWIDETRPRNQGARLTAYELGLAGIPHTVITDNAGGHIMQHGMVDMVIVGSDRTTRNGDVANKIGTYLKALAAADNNLPFYVALPTSTFDLTIGCGLETIPVEERSASEVESTEGWDGKRYTTVRLVPESTSVANYGFDVTPARLITGLITEKGVCHPSEEGILSLISMKNE